MLKPSTETTNPVRPGSRVGEVAGIASIAIPAVWQLSGYIMALFLAGFRGIPATCARPLASMGPVSSSSTDTCSFRSCRQLRCQR